VGVLAKIDDDKMKMRAQLFVEGAVVPRQAEVEGATQDYERLAVELLSRLGAPAFAQGYGLAGEHERE
jgi:hypothetical protein